MCSVVRIWKHYTIWTLASALAKNKDPLPYIKIFEATATQKIFSLDVKAILNGH